MDLDDPALAERFRQHKAKRARLGDEITLASSASSTGTPPSPRQNSTGWQAPCGRR